MKYVFEACPFCGRDDADFYENHRVMTTCARCDNCGATGPDVDWLDQGREAAKEQAYRDWNRRRA